MADELIYKDECCRIVGACFEVYNEKGCGFLEPVYQEFMEIEFGHQKIPFIAQSPLKLSYRGRELKQRYIPDFIFFGRVIVELKAVSKLADEHRAQVINYLNASGFELGLLINFGSYPKLEWERIVSSKKKWPAATSTNALAKKTAYHQSYNQDSRSSCQLYPRMLRIFASASFASIRVIRRQNNRALGNDS
jgi:GxxExxY protein